MRSALITMPQIGRGGPGKRGAPGQDGAQGSAEEARDEALRKLDGLLDSGVLTEEQHEAEKQKILKRA
jgi:hypothetical protein